MRFWIAPFVLLVSASFAIAQAKPPRTGSDWSRVQNLAPGTEIRVSSKSLQYDGGLFPHTREYCNVVSTSDAGLVCTHSFRIFFFPVRHELRYPRGEVTVVRLTKTSSSSAVGALIGLGAGVGLVGAVSARGSDHAEDPVAYALVGILGAFIGSGIGKATDFMGGPTIYRAP
jgi:hypothetical protein